MPEDKAVLRVPKADRVRFRRNFIKTAVCELRFPTLLQLEKEPPRAFQASIRKQYPFYERQVDIDVGAEAVERDPRYLFRSKDKQWTVAVKSFSIAMETTKYVDFEDFLVRFEKVLSDAKEMIDSDFFTRVGLRYVNWIPLEDHELQGWIRSELLPPIGAELGAAENFRSLVQGYLEDGQYALRQSLKRDDQDQRPATYIFDTDYFKENVEFDDVIPLVRQFNETNFSLFMWSLGDKAKRTLGEGKAK